MTGSTSRTKELPHIVIVGAGIGGISTAIALKKRLNFTNFTIYEKASSIGGTWRDNTYPGCGSDVPGHWYSLSTDLNPYWSKYYVGHAEILAYWENLWNKYELGPQTRFNTTVLGSEWDADKQQYTIELETEGMEDGGLTTDAKAKTHSSVTAEVLFFAVGAFGTPLYPKDVQGVENFRGPVWHSARWRHDVELRDKRVGVIGNGCSAAQLIPEIATDSTTQIVNFCRTAQWYIPREDVGYPGWLKWMFAHLPFLMRWYRNSIMIRSDLVFLAFRKKTAPWFRKVFTSYMRHHIPKAQRERMTPKYSPGCKRMIVDPGYLASLKRDNVDARWDTIEGVEQDGIRLQTGELVPLDVLVFATGFAVNTLDLKVKGSKGLTTKEYFDLQGGPSAYLGSCMPGFPNMFVIMGPNTATGHASIIFTQEVQIEYAMQLVRPVVKGYARSFEVKGEACDEYNAWLQKRLESSVWNECDSYYQWGRNQRTKIFGNFPGPVSLFWWMTRSARWEDFEAVEGEAWVRRRRVRTWMWTAGVIGIAVGTGLLAVVDSPVVTRVVRVVGAVLGLLGVV